VNPALRLKVKARTRKKIRRTDCFNVYDSIHHTKIVISYMVFALILVLHLVDILMLYAGRRARLTFCILLSRFTEHSCSRIS
jgi:hypothetical protein